MGFKSTVAGGLVQEGELDLPVRMAGPGKGRIRSVVAVYHCNNLWVCMNTWQNKMMHLDLFITTKAVELVQKLKHHPLHLMVTADGIQFMNEGGMHTGRTYLHKPIQALNDEESISGASR